MSEDKPKRRSMFGRRKKKEESSSSLASGSLASGSQASSPPQKERKTRRKKGIGTRIKRLVRGRKKSKRSGDDDASGVSMQTDKDDPNYNGPRTALDPDVLAKVMEEEEYPTGTSGQRQTARPAFDEDEDEDEFDDHMSAYEQQHEVDELGDLSGPISLVLLLVDPQTLRFELLQLEFESVQGAKVIDVLEQIKESITEPSIRKLDYQALVDRKGQSFAAKVNLAKAVSNRRHSKDILVGLSTGFTPDQCGLLARPILGDAKVVSMLEENGYDVRGWAKNRKEESHLNDSTAETFQAKERKRQMQGLTKVGSVLFVFYLLYQLYAWRYGPIPIQKVEEVVVGLKLETTTEAPVHVDVNVTVDTPPVDTPETLDVSTE
eukprot:Nitzschia sp. Nitz4//scaffold211_size37880//14905//16146//NITZ4_007704-RA/size37880-augustus-gene-0.60-mRNA-1//-1//CDS//3329541973//1067//frame0